MGPPFRAPVSRVLPSVQAGCTPRTSPWDLLFGRPFRGCYQAYRRVAHPGPRHGTSFSGARFEGATKRTGGLHTPDLAMGPPFRAPVSRVLPSVQAGCTPRTSPWDLLFGRPFRGCYQAYRRVA